MEFTEELPPELPVELWMQILHSDILKEYIGIINMVCRKWRDIISEKYKRKITYVREMDQSITLIEFGLYLKPPCPYHDTIVDTVAKYGNLFLLKHFFVKTKSYHHNILCIAAEYGHVHILDWLVKNTGCGLFRRLSIAAGRGGHIHVLEWLVKHKFNRLESIDVSVEATKHDHLHVLKWLREHGYEIYDTHCSKIAAEKGNMEILEWIYENGYNFSSEVASWAAYNKNYTMLELATLKNIPMDSEVCAWLAYQNDKTRLIWAIDRGFRLSDWVSGYAARAGNFGLLKWLCSSEIGCPCTGHVLIQAVLGNHFEIVEWLCSSEIGSEYYDIATYYAAHIPEYYNIRSSEGLKIYKYLEKKERSDNYLKLYNKFPLSEFLPPKKRN